MRPIDPTAKCLLALLAAGVWGLALWPLGRPSGPEAPAASFEELTVERLNIVDPDGSPRVVISNAPRFPLPVLGGREFPRSIQPAGLVFYKANGDECGGVGLVGLPGTDRAMLIFDYQNSEAVGIGMTDQGAQGCSAGISIVDRQPLDADIAAVGSTGTERVSVSNTSGSASVVLSDAQGRPRIRLFVEADGSADIQILDPEGEPVFSAAR